MPVRTPGCRIRPYRQATSRSRALLLRSAFGQRESIDPEPQCPPSTHPLDPDRDQHRYSTQWPRHSGQRRKPLSANAPIHVGPGRAPERDSWWNRSRPRLPGCRIPAVDEAVSIMRARQVQPEWTRCQSLRCCAAPAPAEKRPRDRDQARTTRASSH